jgi:hypothetical protein
MKKLLIISLLVITLLPGMACKKDKKGTTFSAPNWVLVKKELHPYSMTAVVKIDEAINNNINITDQFGAFVGTECRGKGVPVTNNGSTLFYVQIHGSASEQSKLTFQYYNAKNGYMYQSTQQINFTVDDNIGSVDNPWVIPLKRMD